MITVNFLQISSGAQRQEDGDPGRGDRQEGQVKGKQEAGEGLRHIQAKHRTAGSLRFVKLNINVGSARRFYIFNVNQLVKNR